MSYVIVEDGDTIQIRATISDTRELAELIAKLGVYKSEWGSPLGGASPIEDDTSE
jgi:hypothetical protein